MKTPTGGDCFIKNGKNQVKNKFGETDHTIKISCGQGRLTPSGKGFIMATVGDADLSILFITG